MLTSLCEKVKGLVYSVYVRERESESESEDAAHLIQGIIYS